MGESISLAEPPRTYVRGVFAIRSIKEWADPRWLLQPTLQRRALCPLREPARPSVHWRYSHQVCPISLNCANVLFCNYF